MLTDAQMNEALALFRKRTQKVTDNYLKKMGEHIRDIGQLTPSDVHRLQQIRRMDRNLNDIKKQLAQLAGTSTKDLERVLNEAARVDSRVTQKILGVSDADVSLKNNVALQRALRAQIAETEGTLRNLSRSTVVSTAYKDAVDAAVTAVQSGVEDYNSAIRSQMRQAGAFGLRIRENGTKAVEYASGHTRRLDSAVNMNVLDAMRRMNQQAMNELGREFGANGVEIDAHMLCAEDHLPYQGQQYSNEEFQQIQDSLVRPFGEWNCRHTWSPIILGISQPAYTPEQLNAMERYSTEEITIDGRTKTRYEWSQEMRRCETAIRAKKDTANLAAASGDSTLKKECQRSVVELSKYYEQLANKAGLEPDFRRTYVAGIKGPTDAGAGPEIPDNGFKGVVDGKDISMTWERRPDQYQFEIQDVLAAQGFDGVPRIVSPEEFDKAVKLANGGEGFIAQRSYSAPTQEVLDEYRKQLYSGQWYVDCSTGGAQYGQGMYCAADYTGKLTEGIKTEMEHYTRLGRQRDAGAVAYVETLTLDPTAKVIKYNDAEELFKQYRMNFAYDILRKKASDAVYTELGLDSKTRKDYSQMFELYASGYTKRQVQKLERMAAQYGLTVHGEEKSVAELDARIRAQHTILAKKKIDNIGSYVASIGYDAINAEGHGKSGSYTVVLNRTKLIIRGR